LQCAAITWRSPLPRSSNVRRRRRPVDWRRRSRWTIARAFAGGNLELVRDETIGVLGVNGSRRRQEMRMAGIASAVEELR
jgi:hypothetical protein